MTIGGASVFCTKYDYLNTNGRTLHFEEIQHLGGHVKLKVLGTGNRFVTKPKSVKSICGQRKEFRLVFINMNSSSSVFFVFVVATHLYAIYYIKDVTVML